METRKMNGGAAGGIVALCWEVVPWRDQTRRPMKAIRMLREVCGAGRIGEKSGLITLSQEGGQHRGDKIADFRLERGTAGWNVAKVIPKLTTNDPKLCKFDSNVCKFDPNVHKFGLKL